MSYESNGLFTRTKVSAGIDEHCQTVVHCLGELESVMVSIENFEVSNKLIKGQRYRLRELYLKKGCLLRKIISCMRATHEDPSKLRVTWRLAEGASIYSHGCCTLKEILQWHRIDYSRKSGSCSDSDLSD